MCIRYQQQQQQNLNYEIHKHTMINLSITTSNKKKVKCENNKSVMYKITSLYGSFVTTVNINRSYNLFFVIYILNTKCANCILRTPILHTILFYF